MAVEKQKNRVFAESPEEQKAREESEVAARVKYKNDAIAARVAKFRGTDTAIMSVSDIRQARQQVIDNHVPVISPDSDSQVVPVDNPIPVRHNGEEPGEPDKGEDPELVKIREDVQDFTPQPEGHRVPEEVQLNGETGDGGVAPEEAKVELGPDGMELDTDGKGKGLKELADGTVIDSEADQNSKQPEGHNPEEAKVKEAEVEDPKVVLARKQEEYKEKFGKPANGRWSVEHIQNLIDGKV